MPRTWKNRAELKAEFGKVWTEAQFNREFKAIGYLEPDVAVIRRADRKKGLLTVQMAPRYYHTWRETAVTPFGPDETVPLTGKENNVQV